MSAYSTERITREKAIAKLITRIMSMSDAELTETMWDIFSSGERDLTKWEVGEPWSFENDD